MWPIVQRSEQGVELVPERKCKTQYSGPLPSEEVTTPYIMSTVMRTYKPQPESRHVAWPSRLNAEGPFDGPFKGGGSV